MMARRIATMGQSELDGVSDGEWAVFAEKVVEERDALRAEVERLTRERDEARANTEHMSVYRDEMCTLLGKALDVLVLPGHAFATADWERACLLSGRYCEPFLRSAGRPGDDAIREVERLTAERDDARAELSAAFDLPPTIGPCSGEAKRIVDHLKDEVDRLQREAADHGEMFAIAAHERDELRAEVERLRETIARVEALIEEWGPNYGVSMDLRAALKGDVSPDYRAFDARQEDFHTASNIAPDPQKQSNTWHSPSRAWLYHLEVERRAAYLDGVPGELMDALDEYDGEEDRDDGAK
jgi:hypothetical protein